MFSTTIDDDRISQLPEHIIHHILSFLPTPEVVRLSVLSKAWNGFFTCFPMFDFSENSFPSKADDRKLKFANFVYSSLLRQCLQSTRIPKFQLSVSEDCCWSTDLINQSIRLSTQYGVKELSLYFFGSNNYVLPEAIFSLTELVVFRLKGSSLVSTINWPSLREFSLTNVYICHQRIIDNLIFTCPLIEKFALINCEGIGYLKLLGLTKLKNIKIHQSSTLFMEKIEIDSLSLQTFSYACYNWSSKNVHFSLTSCKNIKVLKFFGNGNITDQTIQSLISNFPALKVLVLHGCVSRRIEISSLQLQRLQLYTESKVVAIVINAPRLQSLEHEFRKLPSLFTIKKASNLHEVSLRLYLRHLYYQHDIYFLKKLMEYLRNFNQIKLLTLNISHWDSYVIHQIFRNISHPVFLDINHLKLEIDAKELCDHVLAGEGYEALLNCLFWMRCPESLILSRWGTKDECIKILRKKLISYRGKDHHCCADNRVKCWRHDIKDIQIEHYEEYGDREVVTCDAFLDPLNPLVLKENIRLVFEW